MEDRAWAVSDQVDSVLGRISNEPCPDSVVAAENIALAFASVGVTLKEAVLEQLVRARTDAARNRALQNCVPQSNWKKVETSWR